MSVRLVSRYNEIDAIKKRYIDKVADMPDEQLNKHAGNGQWTAGQLLYHLYFSESGTIKVIQKNLRENKVKNRSGISDILRNILLMGFLRSSMKFKAPAVASKVPDHVSLEEIKGLYEKNTAEFKTLLAELPKELENKQIFKHPISGLFNINQTLNFVREHYLHHEAQLKRLLGK
ncbi:MAG: hypothetical protein JWN78_2509 [Bacteroidota bacterium]|nr:hypothetical protein [Bacteroidota bacterium]